METLEVLVLVLMRDEDGRRSGACTATRTFEGVLRTVDIDGIAQVVGLAATDVLQLSGMQECKP